MAEHLIDPLAKRHIGSPFETAAVESAANVAQTLGMVPVVCGEFNKDIPALADLNQRIVVPQPKK